MGGALLNWRAPLYRLYEERIRGRNTHRYLDFLLDLQWQPEEQIRAFQWAELQRLLRHAAAHVPFYRRRFRELGLSPEEIRTPEDYARLPILEKSDFHRFPDDLLAENADPRRLIANGTGGSTGAPMRYRMDRDSYEWRQAAHMRGNMWAGSGPGVREFHLWGEPLPRVSFLRQAKLELWRWACNHRYFSSYRMTPQGFERYLEAMNRWRPEVVIGYSYSLYLFARFAARSGRRVWSPRGIIGTAERLLPQQRALIQDVFRAPMFDRYGCREVMLIGMECEERRGLHLTADNLYVEILRDGEPARPGEVGEVVVTDLHNYAMPFLRYRNGDLAAASDRRCPCGRGLPLLEEVHGRTLDVLRTPDGRRISGVFVPMFFKDYEWVEEFQLEQTALDRIEVRLKAAPAFRQEMLRALESDLARRIGPAVALRFEIVEEIPRTPTGKHRPVISRVPAEEREHAAAA